MPTEDRTSSRSISATLRPLSASTMSFEDGLDDMREIFEFLAS